MDMSSVTLLIFIVSIILLLIGRKIGFKILHNWAEKTETALDDAIYDSIKTPSIYWAVAIALYISIGVSEIPEKVGYYITRAIFILIIFSVTIALVKITGRLIQIYSERSTVPVPSTGLVNASVKGIILVVGGLIILHSLGISITPLLTALGVGGLAVALALQDSLANLFAGFHILLERSIRVGDFVELENGQKGYILDIGWRTTRVRMLPNNVVIIPNSKLAQSVVVNYYLPEKRMSLLIPIGVSYSADPEQVEEILLDEAKKAAGDIPGLLSEPEPIVRFIPGFGESSLDFTLICQVGEFVDQYYAQHELRKRIFKRFKKEGIEIPFPHRTVYLREEKEW